MSRKTSALLGIIEAAYHSELSREEWLAGIASAASGLDRGVGVVAVQVLLSEDEVGVRSSFAAHGVCNEVAGRIVGRLPQVLRSRATAERGPICVTFSEVAADRERRPADTVGYDGVRDVQWMGAIDETGTGCLLGVCLPRASRTPPHLRATYERIAAHLGSANRIRHKLQDLGTVPGRATRAVDPRLLDALRGAAVALHRHRDATSTVDDATMQAGWQAYVSGRWPVIDRFESDGRQYVIAFASDLENVALPRLTQRELVVVRCAALGLANKVIAHELGLSVGSVTTYLRRAQRKLGIDTRLQLIGRV